MTEKRSAEEWNSILNINEELKVRILNQECVIASLKDDIKGHRQRIIKISQEYELLREECLDVVNIISDARREIFEDQSYKAYDVLGDAIIKLQDMANKEIANNGIAR